MYILGLDRQGFLCYIRAIDFRGGVKVWRRGFWLLQFSRFVWFLRDLHFGLVTSPWTMKYQLRTDFMAGGWQTDWTLWQTFCFWHRPFWWSYVSGNKWFKEVEWWVLNLSCAPWLLRWLWRFRCWRSWWFIEKECAKWLTGWEWCGWYLSSRSTHSSLFFKSREEFLRKAN